MAPSQRGRGRGRGRQRRQRNAQSSGSNNTQDRDASLLQENGEMYDWEMSDRSSCDSHLRNLFLSSSTFDNHHAAQTKFPNRYYACLYVLKTQNIQVQEKSKTLALAATWVRKDYDKARFLLKFPGEEFGIKEVLKALTLLDSGRQKRALEKILKRLQVQGCKKKNKMQKLTAVIGTLDKDAPTIGSLSGSLIRHVKCWLKEIPSERLQFYALHFPPDSWKKFSDLCHVNPEKDLPQCPWFLSFCFGKEIPKDALTIDEVTAENVSNLVIEKEIDFTVARKYKEALTEEAKIRIASYAKLDTVLWYHEEIGCAEVDKVIEKRLSSGERLTLPYGKLMERIIYFMHNHEKSNENGFLKYLLEMAEESLHKIEFSLDSPVSVMGDKSGSMQVAIKTSNIIASLLTAITNADLVFFDGDNVKPSCIPSNVTEVLQLCNEIRAENSTVPAVCLYPYYEEKRIYKTFIVVTDEEENGRHNSYSFAELFKKYYHEVYPSKLVFISFLGQTAAGYMVTQLKRVAPEIPALQFRFNLACPDLSKLDNIFGILSAETDAFQEKISNVEQILVDNDMERVFGVLNITDGFQSVRTE